MAGKRLTHQQKVVIIVLTVTAIVFLVGMGVIIYFYIFATSPIARRKMLAYYRDDNNYIEVAVTLINTDILQTAPKDEKEFYIRVEFDDPNEEKLFDAGGGFSLPVTVYTVLIENGFEFKDGVRYIVTAAPRIWWDGGTPFAIGIKSESGQTYLDYETGKEKLLYYIENVMD